MTQNKIHPLNLLPSDGFLCHHLLARSLTRRSIGGNQPMRFEGSLPLEFHNQMEMLKQFLFTERRSAIDND